MVAGRADLVPRALGAEELVSVPWEKMKGLCQEEAERKAREGMKTDVGKKTPVYTIEEG